MVGVILLCVCLIVFAVGDVNVNVFEKEKKDDAIRKSCKDCGCTNLNICSKCNVREK